MQVKAASLILDFSLYPRHQIPEANVRSIADAIRAGVVLPPIVADKKTKKVIDGFNRVTATLRVLGDDAKIECELRSYRNEREMLLGAMRLNSAHGLKLTNYDKARCATLATEFGLRAQDVAAALNITPERLQKIITDKTAVADGKLIPIKRTVGHMAGKSLTKKQVEGNRKAVGHHQLFLVNQVVNLIEADLLDTSNINLMERLEHLRTLIPVFSEEEVA